MKTIRFILSLSTILCLLLTNFIFVKAAPPSTPSSFYGTVKINGENVSVGTQVTAWINGVKYATTSAFLNESDTVYAMNIPGDDPSTTSVIEGGASGDTIVFNIGDEIAAQTGSWFSGTDVNLNLDTATGFTISGNASRQGVLLSAVNESLTITALSGAGGAYSIFVPYGWSGSLTPSLTGYTFTPTSRTYSTPIKADLPDQDFTSAVAMFSVTVTMSGTGSVTVASSPAGISCTSGTCSASFAYGTSVTLTATPASGYYRLKNWSGDCSGTGTCSVTVTSAKAVTANIETSMFSDVPFNYTESIGGVNFQWYPYIKALYDGGYTSGCSTSPLKYCPAAKLTRAEAAVFMLRAVNGIGHSPTVPDYPHFTGDDYTGDLSWAQAWVESMYSNGLSAGCSDDSYCPTAGLKRDEAAVFALRIKHNDNSYSPPPATSGYFADLSSDYWGAAWVQQAYIDGLLPSCGMEGGLPKACASLEVSRGQAAYMIVKAKDLTLPE